MLIHTQSIFAYEKEHSENDEQVFEIKSRKIQ